MLLTLNSTENKYWNGGFVIHHLTGIPFSGPFLLLFPEVLEWNEEESWFWAGGANSGGIPSNGGKKVAPVRLWTSVVRHHSAPQNQTSNKRAKNTWINFLVNVTMLFTFYSWKKYQVSSWNRIAELYTVLIIWL